jgi:uncharacterized protein YdhG (YjbR/CyaY superfamily)
MVKNLNSIDEYIAQFPEEVQNKLQSLRDVIKDVAPDATEKISYQMPTFYLYGNLVHFAVFSKHIGFYPTSSGIDAFKNELSGYKTSRGTIQFPLEQPLPFDLIKKITRFRVSENIESAKEKGKK